MPWRFIALVLPLGIDTFVVAAALGLQGLSPRQRLRISATFACFEGLMPIVGLAVGRPLGSALGRAADYLAIAVLVTFGLFTAFYDDDDEAGVQRFATAGGSGALVLGLSVSLDELAIGFVLGVLRVPVVPVLIAIATQAFVVTQLGIRLGGRLSERTRTAGERLAGLVLFGLGVALLAEKLLQ